MKRALLGIALIATSLAAGMPGQAHACGQSATAGCAAVPDGVLTRDSVDFGYWMTYRAHASSLPAAKRVGLELVEANIQKHLGGSLNTGVASTSVSRLLARMHLSRFPARYTSTMLSATHFRAVQRVHWQDARGHGPLVRLTWTTSVLGWSITGVTYLGSQ